MVKFGDMPYRRVTYEEVELRCRALVERLKSAESGEDCMEVLRGRHELAEYMTPMELCYVRHDMNTNDPFYETEQDYYDEIGPKLTELFNELDKLLLESPHRPYLESVLGKQIFSVMENGQRSFDSRLVPLLQEENSLVGQYGKITSNLTAEWNGGKVKLSLMAESISSADREIRRKATLAVSEAWEERRREIEDIYDRLVHNRHKQARTVGATSYSELSCRLMNRIGYGLSEIAQFREQVKRYIVPLNELLSERRRKRLGLDRLCCYDKIFFPNGNPKPLGGTEYCLDSTRKMYTMLSGETAEFISFMLDNDLCDVEIRDGKRDGGYMTFFEKYRAPFIFANFDGTSENAYIMCHEGGHAFQGYLNREDFCGRRGCTSEAQETHAMAMEFFTAPYMELFFGERAEDYRIMHMEDAVRLIISECQQDEFQCIVYDNPDMTPGERNALWARLNTEYFPSVDLNGDSNLSGGCGWQRIPHMFHWPFYTVDYALAQICAMEYYKLMSEDRSTAWQSYLSFCRNTGSDSFPNLVKSAGLDNPFEEKTLRDLAKWLEAQLAAES